MSKFCAATPEPQPCSGDVRVLDLVVQDLVDRAEMGCGKYGTYLETNNGRNPAVDAYQEVLDLAMYLRQSLHEGDMLRAELSRAWGRIRALESILTELGVDVP